MGAASRWRASRASARIRGVDSAGGFRQKPQRTKSVRGAGLTGQSIMLVAPQSIEASLIARRLQRGAVRPAWFRISRWRSPVAERLWHAVLLDQRPGAADTTSP